MAELKELLEYLRSGLQEDRLLRRSMFEDVDLEALDKRTLGGYATKLSHIARLLRGIEAESADTAAQDVIDEIMQIAVEKAMSFSGGLDFLDEDEQEANCRLIGRDFQRIARTLRAGVDYPIVNGAWLTYKCGSLPVEPISVEGHLADLIDVNPAQAAKLLAKGREQVAQGEVQEAAEQEALDKAVSSISGPVPDGDLLLKLIGNMPNLREMKAPSTRIVTTAADLDPTCDVPDAWRELLADQDASRRPQWDVVWGQFRELMPAAYVFLEEYCRGIAVLLREGLAPMLLYVYAYPSDTFTCGVDYSCYYGGRPLGEEVPAAHAKKFELLPPRLQEFYRSVHDGWAMSACLDHGPQILDRMVFLGENLTEEECFESREPLFRVDDVLEIVPMHGGRDVVCLDTGRRTPDGNSPAVIWWNHDRENPDTDLDFWEEINRAIAEGYQDLARVD